MFELEAELVVAGAKCGFYFESEKLRFMSALCEQPRSDDTPVLSAHGQWIDCIN